MIGIIDYGLGNINAISNIYNKLKIRNMIVRSVEDLEKSEKLILPGVGAFDSAIKLLNESNLIFQLKKQIFENKKKILGICVGMQIFAGNSKEGIRPGLNWINASVNKINSSDKKNLRLPHMGWNSVNIIKDDSLFKELSNKEYFYFCHSYYFECNDKNNILAETEYGHNFSSIIKNDNLYGVQFHPEKSHDNGVKILSNFSKL